MPRSVVAVFVLHRKAVIGKMTRASKENEGEEVGPRGKVRLQPEPAYYAVSGEERGEAPHPPQILPTLQGRAAKSENMNNRFYI